MQRGPFYRDVVAEVADFFRQQYACAIKFGLDPMTLAFDPGIGFGKRKEQNSQLLAELPQLARLELPVMVGPSRKTFLAHPSERETEFATAGAVAAAVLQGAHLVRVHQVRDMRAVTDVADEILRNAPEEEE